MKTWMAGTSPAMTSHAQQERNRMPAGKGLERLPAVDNDRDLAIAASIACLSCGAVVAKMISFRLALSSNAALQSESIFASLRGFLISRHWTPT